jgi:hypothetical protein
MAAPGTPEGVTFDDAISVSINNLGQIAFQAQVQGPGVSIFDARGLWVADAGGDLHLIARAGGLFDVGGGDLREVNDVDLFTYTNAGEDGMPSAFNDLGQLAFRAVFKDGTEGVFVATVPEPAGLAALVVAAGLLRRRRKQ